MNFTDFPPAALKTSPGQRYEQVAMLIQKWIEEGKLAPGERMPSINDLAVTFEVGVITVRQALKMLEEKGMVSRQQGRGTFVSNSVKDKRWLKIESSWEQLVQAWERSKPSPLKVRNIFAMPVLFPEDGNAAPGYRHMRRVHGVDGVPYATSDLFVDRRHYALCPKRFETEMVIVVLDSLPEVRIKSMRQCLTIETADLEHASLLKVQVGSPVGIVRRVICDEDGTVVYVGKAVYRGDIVKFERGFTKPKHKSRASVKYG
jgi:GntR family transcriptional regulator